MRKSERDIVVRKRGKEENRLGVKEGRELGERIKGRERKCKHVSLIMHTISRESDHNRIRLSSFSCKCSTINRHCVENIMTQKIYNEIFLD